MTRRRFIFDAAKGLMVPLAMGRIVRANSVQKPRMPLNGAGGGGGNTAVTSYSNANTPSSNFDGNLGFRFVPDANMTITHLGRWKLSGNNHAHTITVINNSGTPLGSAVVDFTSGGTVGQFNYTALGSAISLTSGSTYFILSSEVNGGDTWYTDTNGTISFSSHFSSIAGIWSPGGVGLNVDTANNTYDPVDFKFTIP